VAEINIEIWNDKFQQVRSVFECANMETRTQEMLHHTNAIYLLFTLKLHNNVWRDQTKALKEIHNQMQIWEGLQYLIHRQKSHNFTRNTNKWSPNETTHIEYLCHQMQ